VKVALFDTHHFEREYFENANRDAGTSAHELTFFDVKLNEETVRLAFGYEVVCVFVNDHVNDEVIQGLHAGGVRLIALRSAGFNNVELESAQRHRISVVRVPEYSPYAVAELAAGLILSLVRKIPRAHLRVRDGNFSLDGLVGFDLHGKTVGIIGTGKIGTIMARIMSGFGCKLLAADPRPNEQVSMLPDAQYVSLDRIYEESDIISLHVPLTPQTHHILNEKAFSRMKRGVVVINTGRGALIDTKALIESLKSGRVGFAGLDVYEEEETIFFRDLSEQVLQDDVIARLMTFSNVLITSHQGFLTKEALNNIARTTLKNVSEFAAGKRLTNELLPEHVVKQAG
jgi:D-lactate dehydrogenase